MLPAQTRKLLLLTVIACVLPAAIAAADRFEPSRGDILRDVAETLDSTWAYCADPAGRDGLVARIILPAPNPPTQQPALAMTRKFGYIALQPQGSLNGGGCLRHSDRWTAADLRRPGEWGRGTFSRAAVCSATGS